MCIEVAPDWYRRAFGELYPVLYAHRTVETARPEAEFAAAQTGLRSTDTVLDLCCGNGRHMVHLAKCVSCMVGLDHSRELLQAARQTVGGAAHLVCADMRAIPFESVFDAIVNFFTSFGYFFAAEENVQAVKAVGRALKPHGRFFIDYVNRAHVERTLHPRSSRRSGEYALHERRWIDRRRNRINKATEVFRQDTKIGEVHESVCMYSPAEFQELLAAGGLQVLRFFGDYSGGPLDDAHPRMIAVGRKA